MFRLTETGPSFVLTHHELSFFHIFVFSFRSLLHHSFFFISVCFNMTALCQQHPREVQKRPSVRASAWDFLVMLGGNH